MNIAIYIRVSTQEQAVEGYSIDVQKERLSNYCKAKDWIITEEYVDAGYSGSTLERPKIKKLINDALDKKFEAVLVYKLDRLSRSQKDTLYIIEDIFLKNNISFISLNENFDTSTPFGRAIIGILSVFAQLEREQIKERTRMGLEERVKQGKHHSYAPFGYRYINKALVIDDNEAEIVKKIYSLASQNLSFRQINNYITLHYPGYKSFSNKNNKISDILHNPTYGGYVRFGNVTGIGAHQPIVDEVTYKKVQNILNKKRSEWETARTKRTGAHSNYLLTGFIFCGECGARFRAYPRHSGVYICYSRFGNPPHMVKDHNCKCPIYKIEELDNIVVKELEKINSDENYYNSLKANSNNNFSQAADRNKKELEVIETQLNKLLDLYQFEGMDFDTVTPRINMLSKRKKQLQENLLKLEKTNIPPLKYKEVKTLLKSLDELIESKATDELRQLLQTILNKVVISNNGLQFFWNFS